MASAVKSFVRSFNSKIEEPVRIHLKNVYACLALSTVSAAVGAYVDMYTNLLRIGFLSVFGALGFLLALQFTVDDSKNRKLRLGYLIGFSFCTGLGLGPLLDIVIDINPAVVPTAIISTSLIFVAFSLSALFAKRGSWLFLGGLISTTILFLFFATLAGFFFRSPILFKTHIYIGLALMCAFVLYDTQIIMEKRRMGDKDFIGHSVDLFIDFVGIFRRLLIILAERESEKRDKRR